MNILRKISKLSIKSKIIISVIMLVAIISITGEIVFINKNQNVKTTTIPIIENDEINIPEVDAENTKFEISETEPTEDNVIIDITSKLEEFNLYYFIIPEDVEDNNQEIDENEFMLYEESIEIEENSKIYFKYELNNVYSENPYLLEVNNINKSIPQNEGATEEELKKEKVEKVDNTAKYYIIVNYASNVVTIYGKDANGEYTVPVKAMVCSTGSATPTSGVYKLTNRRFRWRTLFGGVYGQYAVKIVGNILFHSVPYVSPNNDALEYWEYDKLGTSASMGCIRLCVADAMWIYNNCGSGTQVEFSASASNPLGKPSARKISGYPELRNYDPTDPISNNPWRNANYYTDNSNTNKNNNNTAQNSNNNKDNTTQNNNKDNDNNSENSETTNTNNNENTTTNNNETINEDNDLGGTEPPNQTD